MKDEQHKRGRPRELGPTVSINVRLPDEVYAALAAEAEMNKTTVSEVVRAALARHAAEKGERNDD